MAKDKDKANALALARLTPNATVVVVDGQEVRVASDAAENRVMNQVMASQVRHLVQQNIKRYNDLDKMLTPKELRDLAEAAKSAATFSGEVYASGDGPHLPRNETDNSDPIDLSLVVKPKEEEKPAS